MGAELQQQNMPNVPGTVSYDADYHTLHETKILSKHPAHFDFFVELVRRFGLWAVQRGLQSQQVAKHSCVSPLEARIEI